MSTVLVGVDGSGTARSALREAVTQASWRNASVCVVNVVHFPAAMGFESSALDIEALRASGQAIIDDEMTRLRDDYPDGLPVEVTSQIRLGHVGSELITIGDDDEFDVELTVVGSRGYGGFRGLIVGSVTTYLVHHLETPLLIVPSVPEDAR